MPQSKAEQIKIYIIIGLLVVAGVVAYFRFFHKKKPSVVIPAPGTPTAGIPAGGLTVPEVKIKEIKSTAAAKTQALKKEDVPLRNIFVPARWPRRVEAQPELVVLEVTDVDDMEWEMAQAWADEDLQRHLQPKPFPRVTLLGTLIGGKKPLAIIDDRFMRAGDTIDGYKITEITADEVRLEGGGEEVVLKVLASGVDQ